ncbi:MAG TPA: M20/M25/M40 family metallo-hydrolase, partial [Lacipirellulaceae bacterium]|nr:M20/M25/M40 family metallo-hydrolase [Lacipirellulaceae bacterium]
MVKQSPVAVAGVAWPDARWDQLAAEALARCDALARCSDDGQRIHRLFCSPAMSDAHRLASQWLTEAGLALRVDAAANLVGRWESPGCDPRRRLILGSHLDTVIDAGRYDGVLGVVLGIAVASALAEIGARLPWALEVYGFSDEEGVRFGVPFLGSRALAGTLDAALLRLCDPAGTSMAQALRDFGVDPLETPRVAASGDVVGYIEAHIEQGPLLEMIGAPLGV